MKYRLMNHVILMCFLLLSCKKGEGVNGFLVNESYQTGNTASLQPVRLFTRNGELTDTALIRKFIVTNTTGGINPFIFGSNTEQISYTILKISFTSNSNAVVERHNISYPSIPGSVESHAATYDFTSGSDIKIQEIDTISIIEANPLRCGDLFENSFLNHPLKQCTQYSYSQYICNYVNSFSLKLKNENLSLPLLIVLVKSTDIPGGTGGCSIYNFVDRWYTFNTNHINTLGPLDTVAIQAKELPLYKL